MPETENLAITIGGDVTHAEDPRLHRAMTIRRGLNGRREVRVDGVVFPTFTRGDIVVKPMMTGGYRDSGGFWPASPEDVYVEEGIKDPVFYEVTIRCFVDSVDVEDPELLKAAPDAGD